MKGSLCCRNEQMLCTHCEQNTEYLTYLLLFPLILSEAVHYLTYSQKNPSSPAPLSPSGEVENARSFIEFFYESPLTGGHF